MKNITMMYSTEELLEMFDKGRKALGMSRRAYGLRLGINEERIKSFFRADRKSDFDISYKDASRIIDGIKQSQEEKLIADNDVGGLIKQLLNRVSELEKGMKSLGVEISQGRDNGHSKIKKSHK